MWGRDQPRPGRPTAGLRVIANRSSVREAGRARGAGQLAENVKAAFQDGGSSGVGDAEMGVAAAEDVTRNDQQVVANGLSDELGGRAPGCARERVKRVWQRFATRWAIDPRPPSATAVKMSSHSR